MSKKGVNFIAVDIETTGFSHIYDSIIQVGAVHIEGGKVVNEFNRYVRTSKIIPKEVTKVTGITERDLAYADTAHVVLDDFLEFCGELTICCHNKSFDIRFLKHKIKTKLQVDFNNEVFCTMQYAKKTLKNLPNHKLNTVATHYGIPNPNHHNALNDAKVCADIALCQLGLKPVAVDRKNPLVLLGKIMNSFVE